MEELSLIFLFFLSLIGLLFTLMMTLTRFFDYNFYLNFKSTSSIFLKSSFYRFLGIPLDLWINFYYISVLFFVTTVWLDLVSFNGLLFLILIFGLFFSLYTVVIQVFVIKKIFGLLLVTSFIPFLNLFFLFLLGPVYILGDWISFFYTELFILIKVFASVGFVFSVFSFFTFLSFMDDLKISAWEAKILSSLSEGIWFSIITLLSFLVGILWVNNIFTETQNLSLMLGIVLVTAICEFIKMVRIRPGLIFLSVKKDKGKSKEKELLKRLSFGVEGISLVSWLTVFVFFILPVQIYEASDLTGIYLLLIIIAFLLSQFINHNLHESNKNG